MVFQSIMYVLYIVMGYEISTRYQGQISMTMPRVEGVALCYYDHDTCRDSKRIQCYIAIPAFKSKVTQILEVHINYNVIAHLHIINPSPNLQQQLQGQLVSPRRLQLDVNKRVAPHIREPEDQQRQMYHSYQHLSTFTALSHLLYQLHVLYLYVIKALFSYKLN